MKQLLLFLLLFTTTTALCDTEDEPYFFYEDQVVYVLGDSVNLRDEAKTASKVVTQLAIGTRVRIIRKTDTQLMLNGFTMSWYFVETAAKQRGYVWGGKLARHSTRSNKNTDYAFHFGLEKVVNGMAFYQIRVEKNKKEVQRVSFRGFGGPFKQHEFTNFGNRGLTNVDDVIYIDGYAEACGEEAGAVVFFWSGEKLWEVRRLMDFSDVPVFASETFIFPADMEGSKGKIILHETIGEHVFPEDDPTVSEHTVRYEKDEKTQYTWDGKKLVKK